MCLRLLILTLIVYLQRAYAIISGQYAETGMYDFAAAITEQRIIVGGGTIVSKCFIVTAAHIFKGGPNYTDVKAIVGTVDLSLAYVENSTEHIKNVAEVIIHPNFSLIDMDFDIAILRLQYDLALGSQNLKSIKFASPYNKYYGDLAVALGWDQGDEHSFHPPIRLRYVQMQVWNRETCNSKHIWGNQPYYLFGPLVTERMLCASVPERGPGTCDNDDGAALLVNNEFLGIMSWRCNCHSLDKPSVYISIPLMLDWITKVISNLK